MKRTYCMSFELNDREVALVLPLFEEIQCALIERRNPELREQIKSLPKNLRKKIVSNLEIADPPQLNTEWNPLFEAEEHKEHLPEVHPLEILRLLRES